MMIYLLMMIFQSTLPREERPIKPHLSAQYETFQSTLPREERPNALMHDVCNVVISIHAPTRGATKIHDLARSETWISIHAPTRGATVIYFLSSKNVCISIHAPTRGATKLYR